MEAIDRKLLIARLNAILLDSQKQDIICKCEELKDLFLNFCPDEYDRLGIISELDYYILGL